MLIVWLATLFVFLKIKMLMSQTDIQTLIFSSDIIYLPRKKQLSLVKLEAFFSHATMKQVLPFFCLSLTPFHEPEAYILSRPQSFLMLIL